MISLEIALSILLSTASFSLNFLEKYKELDFVEDSKMVGKIPRKSRFEIFYKLEQRLELQLRPKLSHCKSGFRVDPKTRG
jgi:hypothetical protein